MSRIGNKNHMMSFRLSDRDYERLEKITDKYFEHTGSYERSYAAVIRKLINYVSNLDLDDKDLFYEIFGSCLLNTFKK